VGTPREDHRTPEQREAAAIQRAFSGRLADIRRCFANAPPDAPEQLVLRFSIDTSGAVQQLDLTPADAAATEHGRCVTRIAQGIRLPAPSAPRTFRIPIEVRSR
jgi:hypothetical protein